MAFAPDNSNYVLTAPDSSLSNYHVMTAGLGLNFTPGAAQGNSTMAVVGNLALLANLATSGYLSYNSSGALNSRTFASSSTVTAVNGNGLSGNTSFNVIDGSSIQKLSIQAEGDLIGAYPTLNFFGTGGTAVTGEIDSENNRINVYVDGGGGGGQAAPGDADYYVATANEDLPNAIVITLPADEPTKGALMGSSTATEWNIIAPPSVLPGTTYYLTQNDTNVMSWTAIPTPLSFPLSPAQGGTGITTTPAVGNILIGADSIWGVLAAPSVLPGATYFLSQDADNLISWQALPTSEIEFYDDAVLVDAASKVNFQSSTTINPTLTIIPDFGVQVALDVTNDSSTQRIIMAQQGVTVGTRQTIDFRNSASLVPTLTEVSNTVQVSFAVQDSSSTQKINVQNDGAGTQNSSTLNLIDTATLTWTLTDVGGVATVTPLVVDSSSTQKVNVQKDGAGTLNSSTINFVTTGTVTPTISNVGGVTTVSLAADAAGTVTSIGLSSPNTNAILGGTNPVTSSGTISINVGCPIISDAVNSNLLIGLGITAISGTNSTIIRQQGLPPSLSTGTANTLIGSNVALALTSSNANVIIGSAAASSLAGSGDANVLIGNSVAAAVETLDNSVILGFNAAGGAAPFNVTDSVILGYEAGYGLQSASLIQKSVVIGKSAANNLDGITDSVIIGDSTYTSSTPLTDSVIIGASAGASSIVYENVIVIGKNAKADIPYSVNMGDYNEGYSISLFPYQTGSTPPLQAGQASLYLEATREIVAFQGGSPLSIGAIPLAKNGSTCGTATLAAGVNPTVTITGAVLTVEGVGPNGSKILLGLRPITPSNTYDPLDNINVVTQQLSDTGFTILGIGTLTNDVYVDWFIVNNI